MAALPDGLGPRDTRALHLGGVGASSAVSSYLEGLAPGRSPRIWCPCQTEEGSASVNRGQGDWPLGASTELSSEVYVSLPLGGTCGLST